MKSLQASMIIRNEQEMLPRALDSLKGIDKIMICDTGSSDGTFQVYEDYQKKGFPLEWFKYSLFSTEDHIKSFSHARNECKSKCTGDWLFILDGDEWFDWDIKKIKNMINSQWVHKYNVLTLECKTAQEQTKQPRAFRNRQEIWYYSAFHNTLRSWPDGLKGKSEMFRQSDYYSTTLLINADYSPEHEKNPDRTLNILTNSLKENPYDTRAMYYISREWLQRQEPLKAFYYLLTYSEMSPPTNELAEVYFNLSTIYADMQIWSKAGEYALKCVGILPSFTQAWQMIYAISHPDFKKYWKAILDISDNKGVMFVRK